MLIKPFNQTAHKLKLTISVAVVKGKLKRTLRRARLGQAGVKILLPSYFMILSQYLFTIA